MHRLDTGPDRLSMACACNQKRDKIRCGFVSFSKDEALGVAGRPWRCIRVCIRLCTDSFEKEQRQAQSAYQPHQLAHFAASQLEPASINVKQLKQTLAPYLQATPSDSWYGRVVYEAKCVKQGGTPEAALRDLLPLAAALREKAWTVEIDIKSPVEMQQIIIASCRAAHKPADGTFDVAKLPQVDPNKNYITAIRIAPPWARQAFGESAPVTNADFTFTKKMSGIQQTCRCSDNIFSSSRRLVSCRRAIFGVVIALDANMQCLELIMTLEFDNEGTSTWTHMNKFTTNVIPDWNSDKVTNITDRHTSHRAAFERFMVESLYDHYHVVQNLRKIRYLGTAAVDAYKRAFHANSLQELADIKHNHFTDAMNAYFVKYPDSELYPVARPTIGKRVFGSAVEGLNAANRLAGLRDSNKAYWLFEIADAIAKRAIQNRDNAQACSDRGQPLPPKSMQQGRSEEQFGNSIGPSSIILSSDGKTCSVRDEAGLHTVTYEKLKTQNAAFACSCQGDLGIPCRHVYAAAKEKQVSVASLLPKFDTTAGYVAQYSAVGDYASIMPTAEDIEKHRNLSDDKLAFPPWYKNEAGRPRKETRYQAATEGGAKRRPRRCTACGSLTCSEVRTRNYTEICPHPKKKKSKKK